MPSGVDFLESKIKSHLIQSLSHAVIKIHSSMVYYFTDNKTWNVLQFSYHFRAAQAVKIFIALAVFCTFGLQFFVCVEIAWDGIKEKFTQRPLFVNYVMRYAVPAHSIIDKSRAFVMKCVCLLCFQNCFGYGSCFIGRRRASYISIYWIDWSFLLFHSWTFGAGKQTLFINW